MEKTFTSAKNASADKKFSLKPFGEKLAEETNVYEGNDNPTRTETGTGSPDGHDADHDVDDDLIG